MGFADYWCHVVFAMRFESNIPQDDHFVVALDFFERAFEVSYRVLLVAAKPILIGSCNPLWRVSKAFTTWILTGPKQQCMNSLFGFLATGLARFGMFFLFVRHLRYSAWCLDPDDSTDIATTGIPWLGLPYLAANAGSTKTAVAVCVLRKVLLVIILGIVKGIERHYFGRDIGVTRVRKTLLVLL